MGAATASAVEPLASAVGDRPSIGDNRGNRQSGSAMPASAGNLRIPVAPPRPIRDSKQRREHALLHMLGPGPTAPRGVDCPAGRGARPYRGEATMIGQEFSGRTGAGHPAGAGRHRFRPGRRRRSAIRLPGRPGLAAQAASRAARPGQPVPDHRIHRAVGHPAPLLGRRPADPDRRRGRGLPADRLAACRRACLRRQLRRPADRRAAAGRGGWAGRPP